MEKLSGICPYCGGAMKIERTRCGACKVAVEGEIPIPRLARLSPEEREFIELFVKSSGSLKAVAQKLDISYPTVRNRLDQIIDKLKHETAADREYRRRILDGIEDGKISVDEAIKLLREL
ncbi:MAG: hypothetical protein A2W23_08255 [Planctomycetes bacterium RBG_16_43_13]|nr:MAG: hypothetical protein A2W23_08255 [Planctomycetes bacterium RBG_16_43_13]